ncbi:MAG: hypothetical protein A2W18_15065 [Candidatus Muproteobacteria bacterium RBG_16_60_9]|uniref:Uncharacterized protein n=1 Tax=Candidatus Muproteobacteria bacterium RBG_16_60_9 TaxID=1817755 RepID=A0A1F6UWH0_9PROT|nr:MAG: hypothetical protein A2W18_15065 [Candidatus Muproteobacteria bacterium RBG_16_60_9]
MNKKFAVILLAVLGPLDVASAADRADLEGAQITGSRELPKVLYIVPWKQPLPTDLVGRPAQSLLDEALAPIDREVFRREVQYHALLQDVSTSPNAAATESKTK